MGVSVGQVGGASRVSTTNRTLLEVTLQNITATESVAAENAHVGAISGI